MSFLDALRLALQQVRAQKLKSGFSLIGVFIGVTFLIIAWSIVNGVDTYMTDKFAGTLVGVNTFHLRRRPNFTRHVESSTLGVARLGPAPADQLPRRRRGGDRHHGTGGHRVAVVGSEHGRSAQQEDARRRSDRRERAV